MLCLMSSGVNAEGGAPLLRACQACHTTQAPPPVEDIPIIAGQPFTVIEDALILFAQNERPCTTMCALAAALSPEDRETLANELEQQAFVPAIQEFDSALAAAGAGVHQDNGCETCHAEGGREGQGMAPILAGQRTPYLKKAFLQLRSGQRSGPKVMNKAILALSEHDIEALLNFYASHVQQD